MNAKDATRAVMHTLTRHVDPGQVAKVVNALPDEIRTFWTSSAAVATRPLEERTGGRAG